MKDARWMEMAMAMTRQEVAEVLQRLLESQRGLQPEERKALKVAIKELRR